MDDLLLVGFLGGLHLHCELPSSLPLLDDVIVILLLPT